MKATTETRSPLDRALRSWHDEVIPVGDASRVEANREATVSRLQATLATGQLRAAQRRRGRIAASLVAVALVAAGFVALFSSRWVSESPAPSLVAEGSDQQGISQPVDAVVPAAQVRTVAELELRHGDGTRKLEAGQEHDVAVDDEISVAEDGRATLTFRSGVSVVLEGETQLRVTRLPDAVGGGVEELSLTAGRIDTTSPKLAEDLRFAIRTADARVVIRGTRFTVSVHDATEPRAAFTRVEVSEGIVEVEYEGKVLRVGAGKTWQSTTKTTAPAPARPAPLKKKHPVVAAPPELHATPKATSSLAEQNRLFKAATQARARGDHAEAAALFGQLLSRFPTSPLAPDARAHRARALEQARGEK